MGLIPEFEYDIFISYAHIDNLPINDQGKGWVDLFHDTLKNKLIQHFGVKDDLKIWYDVVKIDGTTVFDEKIETDICKSAIIICLNSPAYQKSDFCQTELKTFYNKATSDKIGSLSVNHRSRIINVLLKNILPNDWPKEFAGSTGFNFHTSSRTNYLGDPIEIPSTRFNNEVLKLRDAVFELVNDILDAKSTTNKTKTVTRKKKVQNNTIPLAKEEDISKLITETSSIHNNTRFDNPGQKKPWFTRLWVAVILLILVIVGTVAFRWGLFDGKPRFSNEIIRVKLMELSKLNNLDYALRIDSVDKTMHTYFADKFIVIATGNESDGRKYLLKLASLGAHLHNITVNSIEYDSSGEKITNINIDEDVY